MTEERPEPAEKRPKNRENDGFTIILRTFSERWTKKTLVFWLEY